MTSSGFLLWLTAQEPHTHKHARPDLLMFLTRLSSPRFAIQNQPPTIASRPCPTRPSRAPARTDTYRRRNTCRVDIANQPRARNTQPMPQHTCTPWPCHVHHHETETALVPYNPYTDLPTHRQTYMPATYRHTDLPTYTLACLHAYRPAPYAPTYLDTCPRPCGPAYTYQPTHIPSNLPTYPPTT